MFFNLGFRPLPAAALLALLAGCAGSNPGAGLTPSAGSAMTNGSGTLPSKASAALAYVTNSSGGVDVYAYPSFTKQQTLTGFNEPQGECVDSAGNVWIVDTGNSRLVEYAHGGSQPIATLSDPGGNPASCAVSSSDGSVAASNIASGTIVVYIHGRGKPHTVATAKPYFMAYDSKGDLFGDGVGANYQFALFELAKGAKSIGTISLNGATINFPGAVQFTGAVLNVGDQSGSDGNSIAYQARVKRTTATVIGTAQLGGSADCVASFIYENRLLCPDAGSGNLEIYRYPKGGNALQSIPGIDGPIVISAVSK